MKEEESRKNHIPKEEEGVKANEEVKEEVNVHTEARGSEDSLASELAKMKEDSEEAKKQYLYLSAEFQNFRKRMQKEKTDFLKFGHEDFLRELLQMKDNFERALAHSNQVKEGNNASVENLIEGLNMILMQFQEALKHQGVNEIESIGQQFNPELHEAVGQEESKDAKENTILTEQLKGYMLHGRLLRASQVITAKVVQQKN